MFISLIVPFSIISALSPAQVKKVFRKPNVSFIVRISAPFAILCGGGFVFLGGLSVSVPITPTPTPPPTSTVTPTSTSVPPTPTLPSPPVILKVTAKGPCTEFKYIFTYQDNDSDAYHIMFVEQSLEASTRLSPDGEEPVNPAGASGTHESQPRTCVNLKNACKDGVAVIDNTNRISPLYTIETSCQYKSPIVTGFGPAK